MVTRLRSGPGVPLEAFLVSAGVVALAEIGDKTQLLAFVLAARFRKPVPIILGILVATLANHTLAGDARARVTSTNHRPPASSIGVVAVSCRMEIPRGFTASVIIC